MDTRDNEINELLQGLTASVASALASDYEPEESLPSGSQQEDPVLIEYDFNSQTDTQAIQPLSPPIGSYHQCSPPQEPRHSPDESPRFKYEQMKLLKKKLQERKRKEAVRQVPLYCSLPTSDVYLA